ncbi:hypothetical protein [Pseudomonas sp.]|uniref:hypothetical protein n=1 Tax=Pseudomonas sp. TaxID=306 RepID=UPI003BB7030F
MGAPAAGLQIIPVFQASQRCPERVAGSGNNSPAISNDTGSTGDQRNSELIVYLAEQLVLNFNIAGLGNNTPEIV